MSTDLAQQMETLGTSLEAPDEHQAAKVRELVHHYARDAADEQDLLDVLFGQVSAGPRLEVAEQRICARPMRGEQICGRIYLHIGPHRSQAVMAASRARNARRRVEG